MIRLCTASDIDDLINLAVECYPKFNVESSLSWLKARISNPDIFIAKGDSCGGMAFINRTFYFPESTTFELEFICCRKTVFGAGECLKLIAFFNALRKERGYDKLYINSRLADLEPFIKRLGGKTGGKTWILED